MSNAKNRQALLLLTVNGLFVLAGALSGTFLNVYLWKSRQDYLMISWFNVAQQLALGLTFWIAGKWVKEGGKMNALRVGTTMAGIFYLLVLISGKHVVSYIWPLGMLLGISLGLFWLAFNVVYFEITDPGSRDWFNGWMGLLGSMTGILGPWISGLMITLMGGTSGYRFIFTLSLLIYAATVVLSFFLKKREVSGTYDWLEGWHRLRSGGVWPSVMGALIMQGLREGVFSFLIALLVFTATKREAGLGQFMLITSAVSLVSYWAAGKWLKPAFRSTGMLIGSISLVVVLLPLLWKVNYMTLLIMGIGTSVFIPLFMLPAVSASFDLMGRDDRQAEKRVELVVVREISLMLGRTAGLLIFIAVISFRQDPLTLNLLLIALGASPFGTWWFMRKILRQTKAVS